MLGARGAERAPAASELARAFASWSFVLETSLGALRHAPQARDKRVGARGRARVVCGRDANSLREDVLPCMLQLRSRSLAETMQCADGRSLLVI